jgi:SpoVK/Ycf46/Vps4 family AAA+-type ATPase
MDTTPHFEIHGNQDYLRLEVERVKALAQARLTEAEGAADAQELERLSAQKAALAQARVEATAAGVGIPLQEVVTRFGLGPLEAELLLVVLAPLLDGSILPIYKRLRGGFLLDGVDVSLAVQLAAGTWEEKLEARRALTHQAPLVANGLLQVTQPRGATNVLHQEVVLPARLLNHLLGDAALAESLAPFCEVVREAVPLERVVLPPRVRDDLLAVLTPGKAFRDSLSAWGYDAFLPYGRGVTLMLTGAPGTGKTLLATALATHLGRPLLRVRSGKLQDHQAPIEPLLADLSLEAAVRDAILFFDDCEGLFAERGARLSALLGFVERLEGMVLFATNQPQRLDPALERRIVMQVELPVPDPDLRLAIWELFLPPELPVADDVDVTALANLYDFTGGTIKNAVVVALNRALSANPRQPVVSQALLKEACDAQLKATVEEYATRTRAQLTLDDVVLPEAEKRQVQEVLGACRNHAFVMNRWGFGQRLATGKGIVALFDGPPGTGKTLCAEVLAHEIGRPLFRVNIPAVVSKWVGETEKHIQDVFARARASQAMLLFDEADALFGKRVAETQSSNDRYANMEVNLLLQEVERFDGIVILTTNLFGSLDDALKRRVLFRVSFPKPDAEHRSRIWQVLLPERAATTPDVDFAVLGKRFDLAGGHIKNAVLKAAYAAAAQGGPIAMRHLLDAGQGECKAAGVLIREGEWSSPRKAGGAPQGQAGTTSQDD